MLNHLYMPKEYCWWVGIQVVLPRDPRKHFLQCCGKESTKAWWFAAVWSLWWHKNDIIYRNEVAN